MIGIGAPIATPVVRHPGRFLERCTLTPAWSADPATVDPGRAGSVGGAPLAFEGAHRRVEYRVRAARITDIDRFVALSGDRLGRRVPGQPAATDILRQLVFLPHATVLVAERRRDLIGGAVLAIRPSVAAGGYVGTIDLVGVDPTADPDDVTASLVAEGLGSAVDQGCATGRA